MSATTPACPKANATLEVNKSAGAAVEAPTLLEKTGISITVNHVIASSGHQVEYALSNMDAAPVSGWSGNAYFYRAAPYYVFAWTVENDLYLTRTQSNSLQVILDRVTGIDGIPVGSPLKPGYKTDSYTLAALPKENFGAYSTYISDKLVYHSIAGSRDADVSLPGHGVYMVRFVD